MCLPDSYRLIAPSAGVSITAAAQRQAGESAFEHADALERERERERGIDLQLEQSFPASDPPGWTLGVADPSSWRADDDR